MIRDDDLDDLSDAYVPELAESVKGWGAGAIGSEMGIARPVRRGVQTTDASGNATIDLGQPGESSYWLVDRGAFVVAVGIATVSWSVFVGTVADENLEEFASLAFAAAGTDRRILEANPPIYVPPRTSLLVRVEGASAAVQARARTVQRELPRGKVSIERGF
jgi:hypothetical protein